MVSHFKDEFKRLIENGADPNTEINENTPLYWSTYYGYYEITELLLEKGADPNIANEYGSVPLYWSIWLGDKRMAELLLKKGADPNQTNNKGNLFSAVLYNRIEIADLLLKNGADPNKSNIYGDIPLHFAAHFNLDEMAKLLLKKGADPNIANNKGRTPLHLIVNESKTKELLEKQPRVVSLINICLRVIHYGSLKPIIPE
jgi:ankyrin repeat protein